MKTRIISIGDELLIGQTVNTNAAYLGTVLTEHNCEIEKVSVIGDELKAIIDEFTDAYDKCEIIAVTGGLGPTHDDLTVKAVVQFFNTELVKNNDVLEDIKERFEKLNRPMSPANIDQALVPKNAEVLRNPYGTAPGLLFNTKGKLFFVLPGVPYEMKGLMQDHVLPILAELSLKRGIITKRITLSTTGIAESALYGKLKAEGVLEIGVIVAFLPSQFGVKIRLTASSTSEENALDMLSEAEQKIRGVAGQFIYSRSGEELGCVVGRLLTERGLRLAVAESCTGGLLSSVLTDYSGSSAFFDRGVVSYGNAAKVEMLEVEEDTIAELGAVSEQVCMQMAQGIRSISAADIGIGISGVMGPTGGTPDKPVGLVFVALSDSENTIVKRFNFGDDRLLNKQRTVQAALDMISKFLLRIPIE